MGRSGGSHGLIPMNIEEVTEEGDSEKARQAHEGSCVPNVHRDAKEWCFRLFFLVFHTFLSYDASTSASLSVDLGEERILRRALLQEEEIRKSPFQPIHKLFLDPLSLSLLRAHQDRERRHGSHRNEKRKNGALVLQREQYSLVFAFPAGPRVSQPILGGGSSRNKLSS